MLGDQLARFGDCYVRVICTKIEEARIARCAELQECLAQTEAAAVRLVLIDETLAPALLDLDNAARETLTAAGVAIAYRETGHVGQHVPALLAWGVRGFMPMEVSLDVLLPIVRLLASGGSHLPTALFQEREAQRRPETGLDTGSLTRREVEILKLLAHGLQNKNIAAELGLSQYTVKLHIHSIIRKLNVSNRTEATTRFFESHPPVAGSLRGSEAHGPALRRG